jgi:hypothetical protein
MKRNENVFGLFIFSSRPQTLELKYTPSKKPYEMLWGIFGSIEEKQ